MKSEKDPSLELETQIFSGELTEGFKPNLIIGVDEAGRGAIAGPLAVGVQAVVKGTNEFPKNLRDSKLLTEKRREALFPLVEEWGVGAVGYAQPEEIDEHGITRMLAQAARRALVNIHRRGVDVTTAVILLDGSHDWLTPALQKPLRVITRVKADRLHASVSAASLQAKVMRDRLMKELAQDFNHYGWESNKGYGARAHYEAIALHGVTSHHRKTWIKL